MCRQTNAIQSSPKTDEVKLHQIPNNFLASLNNKKKYPVIGFSGRELHNLMPCFHHHNHLDGILVLYDVSNITCEERK